MVVLYQCAVWSAQQTAKRGAQFSVDNPWPPRFSPLPHMADSAPLPPSPLVFLPA